MSKNTPAFDINKSGDKTDKQKRKLGKTKKRGCDYTHPHVYVATPAYDGKVDCDFSQSLAESAQAATVFGIYFTASVMGNGAFIDLARNMFVRIFLDENPDCTHLFFIDSDLKWQSSAFVNLILHCTEDRPVVAGAYRRRQEPEEYPIVWTPEPELSKDGIDKLWLSDDGWLQCKRVATGFLCIRRNILEEMAAEAQKLILHNVGPVPRLFYTELDDQGRFIGEDFVWCDDYLKKYGKNIEVWCDFDFVHGGLEGNYAKWIEKEIKQTIQKWDEVKNKTRLGDRRRPPVPETPGRDGKAA